MAFHIITQHPMDESQNQRKFAIKKKKPSTTGKLKTENQRQENKLYLTPRKLQIKEESRTQP